jgi:hypothetical protein
MQLARQERRGYFTELLLRAVDFHKAWPPTPGGGLTGDERPELLAEDVGFSA